MWWFTSVILAVGSLRQEDDHKLEAIPGYIAEFFTGLSYTVAFKRGAGMEERLETFPVNETSELQTPMEGDEGHRQHQTKSQETHQHSRASKPWQLHPHS